MKTKVMTILTAVIVLAITTFTQAVPVAFTVIATCDYNSAEYGYMQGQSYNFTWTLNDEFTSGSKDLQMTSHLGGPKNEWIEDDTSDQMLFSEISGDNLTGTYTRPPQPYSSITVEEYGSIDLRAEDEGYNSLGVTNNNGNTLTSITTNMTAEGLTSDFTEEYLNPSDYFSGRTGTYDTIYSSMIAEFNGGGGMIHNVYFTPETLTISQVPEPATMALLGIGGLMIRRRRRA